MSDPRQARELVEQALVLLEDGDARAAIDVLQRAIALDPSAAAAHAALARAWSERRAPSRAVDALKRAVALDDRTELRLRLGRAWLDCGCPAEAVAALDPIVGDPADGATARGLRGRALLALGRHEEAQVDLETALDELPDHLDLQADLAHALDGLGQHARAEAAWRRLLEAAPRHPEARRRLARRGTPEPLLVGGAADDVGSRALRWARALLADDRVDEALEALEDLTGRDDAPPSAHTWHARALLRARRDDEAEAALDRALEMEHTPRETVLLAQTLYAAGRPESRALLEEARAQAAGDAAVLSGVGSLLARMGDADPALAVLDAALALDPGDVEALAARARLLTALDDADGARLAWRRVLDQNPHHAEARSVLGETAAEPSRTQRGVARIHFDLGRSMMQRSRWREAVTAFRQATEIHPAWSEPWKQLGLAWLALDERGAAADAFRAALERDPDDAESAGRLGDLQREQGALQAALGAYEQALTVEPEQSRALVGRAETRRLLGRFDEAITDHEAALKAAPDELMALAGMAAALHGAGRFSEARPVWLRARELDPNNSFVAKGLAQCHHALRGASPLPFEDIAKEPQPRPTDTWGADEQTYDRYEAMDQVDRGRSYHKERNYTAAIECFRKALEIDPTCDEAALRLGMAYEDDRQFRRAISAYRTCLEIEPNHYQAATNIGEAYRKNEQYREAIEAYDQALALKSDYLYALAGRAECMRMLGRYEDCLGWFDKALAVGPNHAFAIQGKAAALNAMQRFDEAIAYWDRALEIEPQSQFALDGKAYCDAQLKRRTAERPDVTEDDVEVAESETPTLDEQGRDLTALARAGRLPQVIGRDREVRQVMKTLVRRLKANPLLLGEPGVGKTAVVEGLAQRLASGEAPERLQSLRIVELSMGSLIAGTKYRGTFEERLREIVKEAAEAPGLVLFIDEIHTLVGAGRTEGGSLDAANILKPALARGEITVIGATTHAEYRRHFESDSALERRFQPITIDEPSIPDCIHLLDVVSPSYEEHHEVTVDPSALEACVRMAVRFLPDRRLPDKALDMLDEACAEASLAETPRVDAEVVARVVAERTGVPVQKLTEAERTRMGRLEEVLKERVVGQDAAIERLGDAVRMAKAGLRAQGRPRAVFLFRGPSGVGKTELAKALSDFLFPEGEALIRLDMSEYADRFTASRLLGAPPGYSGHGEEGQLTGPLRKRPYSVVLLDEFEKAHPDVQAVFLSLLDEGYVTDADGRRVNAREAFFILTTNAGAEQRGKGPVGFGSGNAFDAQEAALEAVRPWFRPELLDRIDDVIAFEDLDEDALSAIAGHRLEELRQRAAERGLTLTWTDDVPRHLARQRRPTDRGARQIIRAVDTLVGEPLGRTLLGSPEGTPAAVAVSVKGQRLELTETPREAPQPAQPVSSS